MFGWFKALSTLGKAAFVIGSVAVISGAGAAVTPHKNTPPQTQPSKPPVITTKTDIVKEEIPCATINKNDSSLPKGQTVVKQGCKNGLKSTTYKVTLSDGAETSREKVSSKTLDEATNKIVEVGTYVAPEQNCPNGTYVNSSGNTVCNPYSAPSAPSGATAQCNDGTYSFSQHRQGTCSHHGGVAVWL